MNLEVWTDGRFRDNMSVSTSIMLTEDTFVKRIIVSRESTVPYESELYAVLETFRYLVTIDTSKFDLITIYPDAAFLASSFNMLMEDHKSKKNIKFRDVILEMVDLAKQVESKVAMIAYPSHLENHNPNKTCDITCRIVWNNLPCITDM